MEREERDITENPPDKELLKKARGGDEDAFNVLHERYRLKIFNYLLRFFGNREIAADVTQDTFIQVYKNLRSYRGEGEVSSWIYQIATNRAKNALRKISRQRHVSLNQDVSDEGVTQLGDLIDSHVASPADMAKRHELLKDLQGLISVLPVKYRTAFILCEMQGLSYEEAGRVLRCSPNAAAMRLSRAKAQLRKKINWSRYL